MYETLDEKLVALEAVLQELDANPARVQPLAGWAWITRSLDRLSASNAV